MLIVFLASITAFVLIILFFAWYYKKMIHLIFGKMNGMLETILVEGAAPKEWNARLDKLNRKLEKSRGIKGKKKAIERHIRYVEASTKDLCAYAGRTSFIPDDDERADALDTLERFRDETVRILEEMWEELG